jgi:hypothetical protein
MRNEINSDSSSDLRFTSLSLELFSMLLLLELPKVVPFAVFNGLFGLLSQLVWSIVDRIVVPTSTEAIARYFYKYISKNQKLRKRLR